jgi:transcriptional regulator with XRE-family HTH domain
MTIKEARQKAGLTQTQLAEKINTLQVQVARWESGTRRPKWQTLEKIAGACNVSPETLLPNHSTKINRAQKLNAYDNNLGTCNAIFNQIPQSAIEQCSASTLNAIADAIQHAYQAGRAKAGAEMIDNNAVWVDSIKKTIEWDKNFNCKIA